jgi:hypothetical protein
MATVRGPLHFLQSQIQDAVMPANNSRPRGNYTVGYARPPIATRFQPGRSGNTKGRPRKSRPEPLELPAGLSPLNRAVLEHMLTPLDGASSPVVPSTNLEHVIKQAVDGAMSGDVRCLRLILPLYEEAQKAQAASAGKEVSDAIRQFTDILILAKHNDLTLLDLKRELQERAQRSREGEPGPVSAEPRN